MVLPVNKVKKAEKYLGYFASAFAYVSIAALTYLMMVIVVDVFGRKFFNYSIIGSSEYVSLAESIVIFFALAYTQHKKGLVHIAFFMKKLPGLSPMVLWTLHEWCGAFIVGLLTYASWLHFIFTRKVNMSTTALLIPFYPFYLLMAVGFFAYFIVQLFCAVKSTIGLFNPEVRRDVMDNWPA